MLGAALFQAFLGAVLILFGNWGRGAADTLAPPTLDAIDREARSAVYRRGSLTCMVVGALLVIVSVLVLVTG